MPNYRKQDALWFNIREQDFLDETNIEDVDVADFNKEKITIFAANTNYFRQLPNLSDSLKPVERRILTALYNAGALPNKKSVKCAYIVGEVMKFHPHGDGSIYGTLVNMTQNWKKGAPLIYGKGGFGSIIEPDEYSHMRYTEAKLSKYAYECFFEDFDPDCTDMIMNTSSNSLEVAAYAAKFPNILVNGGLGIAIGNAFKIPPYNINDIITVCKRVIKNPNTTDVFMIPDPCYCQIIDDGVSFKKICETGEGKLRMRGRIDIEDCGGYWILRITSIPWMTSLSKEEGIMRQLYALKKSGKLDVDDVIDHSQSYVLPSGAVEMSVDVGLKIGKSHDPNKVRQLIYTSTDLEKTLPVQFKITSDYKVLTLSMKEVIQNWLDGRREYKRRFLNKKVSKISARLELLTVLLELTQKENLDKTMDIVRSTNMEDIEKQFMKRYGMSSFQAKKIAQMRITAFTKDARKRYLEEQHTLEKELSYILDIIYSEKKIDEIILKELDDLKKYATPRKSEIITLEGEKVISDLDYKVIVTEQSLVKKIPDHPKAPLGKFAVGDIPKHQIAVNNMDNLVFFDSKGYYSVISTHSISNTEPLNTGIKLYNFTKLDGSIVNLYPAMTPDKVNDMEKRSKSRMNLITLTKMGFIKKMDLKETFLCDSPIKNSRYVKIKDGDEVTYVDFIFDKTNLIIYTEKGDFVYLTAEDIPLLEKNAQGNIAIKMQDDDECLGITPISKKTSYLLLVTESGRMKLCEYDYLGGTTGRMRSSYLTTLDKGDRIFKVLALQDKFSVMVCTKNGSLTYTENDIPIMSRKAKPKKIVPIRNGDMIISVVEG